MPVTFCQIPGLLLLAVDEKAVHLPLALLLVFGAAKLVAELFERIGQPGIVGEILAGVLLGPSVLNWVQPDQVLTALAEMGVMFLLFRVGLEVKASELLRVGGTALMVALLGVILPFVAGWAILIAFGVSQIEAIFVGASMVATSVGITAQVLAAKGLLQQRASQIILAAAVIDDVLGLLVLALVSNLAQGEIQIAGLITTAVLAGGFTVIIAKFGTRTLKHIIPRVEQKLAAAEAQFNLGLVLLFGLSVLAVYVGVAAIVGAFLAGMAFSDTANRRVLDLAHGITEVLVPFFLVGIGLHFNVSSFANSHVLILSAIVFVAAVLSKLVGCGIATLRLGLKDAIRVGVGMVPRGEVGMVIAQIGLGLGVIEQSVYAVVVFMAVATTLVAPPLLSYAYRDCQPGKPSEEFTLA
jgi:Kef-type K+ transport system membrane component KefB